MCNSLLHLNFFLWISIYNNISTTLYVIVSIYQKQKVLCMLCWLLLKVRRMKRSQYMREYSKSDHWIWLNFIRHNQQLQASKPSAKKKFDLIFHFYSLYCWFFESVHAECGRKRVYCYFSTSFPFECNFSVLAHTDKHSHKCFLQSFP